MNFMYSPGRTIVSSAYNSAVTTGNVILTVQKRRIQESNICTVAQ